MVSLRLSRAVNPPPAHSATPSEPLPSGSDWVLAVFGCPSTTSERETAGDAERGGRQHRGHGCRQTRAKESSRIQLSTGHERSLDAACGDTVTAEDIGGVVAHDDASVQPYG